MFNKMFTAIAAQSERP